jgi:hypothetical protein
MKRRCCLFSSKEPRSASLAQQTVSALTPKVELKEAQVILAKLLG